MKMIAFWKYDVFPFCFWGELVKAEENGNFHIKGYDGFHFKKTALIGYIPAVAAGSIIKQLEDLTEAKRISDKNFSEKARSITQQI